jgi:hypothetical protein
LAADPPTKQEVFRGEKRNKFNKAKTSDWRHMEKIYVFQSVVLARF